MVDTTLLCPDRDSGGWSVVRGPEEARPSFWRELREGVGLVWSSPILRATAAATGFWNLFDGARWAVLILFLTRTVELGAGTVGANFTLGAVGYVLGSLFPERVARRIGLGRAILLGIVLAVPGELLTALAAGPPLMAAAIAGAGFFLTDLIIPTYDVNQFSLRQAVRPSPRCACRDGSARRCAR